MTYTTALLVSLPLEALPGLASICHVANGFFGSCSRLRGVECLIGYLLPELVRVLDLVIALNVFVKKLLATEQ